jgi:LuxR family maltose regulon positive regulatory protein
VTDAPAIELVDALALSPGSWRAPRPRRGLVERDDLVGSLVAGADELVVVTAPAGYGKTTAMLLWDQHDDRPFAWVNLDRLDDDPVHLVRHVAGALATVAPIDPEVRRALASPGRSADVDLVPLVVTELSRRAPLVLVLDDVHLVTSPASVRCLELLVDAAPGGSSVVLVGRTMPTLRLPRRRMAGAVRDIDAGALAMSADEAGRLFAAMEVDLEPDVVDELVTRTEGWAGGLHLAALGIGNRPDGAGSIAGFTGRDRLVADYLVEEVLETLAPDLVWFLERSSILERMSATLLDELLEIDSSGLRLHEIELSGNLFLVPLDGEREWYRYHHLFGELLRSRLRARDRGAFLALQRRASHLLAASGDIDAAIDHAVAAGDRERAAALVLTHAPALALGGRAGVVGRWLDRLDEPTVTGTALGALAQALHAVGIGDAPLAERATAAAVEHDRGELLPDGITTVPVAAAALRAIAARGIQDILDDTDLVLRDGSEAMRPWWSVAVAIRATARSMMGDLDEATELLEAARPGVADLPSIAAGVEAHLAQVSLARDDLRSAEAHVRAARRVRARHDLEGQPTAMIAFATDAQVSARLGHREDARRDAAIAGRLLDRLDDAVTRTALLGHVALARTCLLLDDRAGAVHHVERADRARRREPLATRSGRDLDALHEQLDAAVRSVAGGPALTPAELRMLPYLSTHLSLKEIAGELIISRNTAKSHAVAIYRKLGATSRSEAVARATEVGLLQP